MHGTIMEADIARNFAAEYERGPGAPERALREQIERGQRGAGGRLQRALQRDPGAGHALERDLRALRRDPHAGDRRPGAAGLEVDRQPGCSARSGRFCGMPAVTLPLLQAGNGLPIGVQLVGQKRR